MTPPSSLPFYCSFLSLIPTKFHQSFLYHHSEYTFSQNPFPSKVAEVDPYLFLFFLTILFDLHSLLKWEIIWLRERYHRIWLFLWYLSQSFSTKQEWDKAHQCLTPRRWRGLNALSSILARYSQSEPVTPCALHSSASTSPFILQYRHDSPSKPSTHIKPTAQQLNHQSVLWGHLNSVVSNKICVFISQGKKKSVFVTVSLSDCLLWVLVQCCVSAFLQLSLTDLLFTLSARNLKCSVT